ncbi:MAG: amidohydrolase family protein, partial [Chitinophagales bacterium]
AWNWEDATYKEDMGVHLNWPNLYRFTGWWAEPGPIENNKDYDKYVGEIKNLFDEAKAYCAGGHSTTNLKLEAMCGLFDGSKKLFANVNIIKEIIDVVNFAQEYGVDVVIVGGDDAWMCTDILKQYDIPVMINKTRNLPSRKDEDYDLPYKLPKILQDAGVLYCLTPGQGSGFWDMRNLPFDAGIAVAHGLTKEEALMSLTSNSAKILGIDKTVGTLEVGKDATLIVSKGDILDMMTSHVEQAFIRGRMVDMENKQKALYRRFMDKYDLEHQQH